MDIALVAIVVDDHDEAILRVDDVTAAHQRMAAAGVRFVTTPREETYGRVAVFLDVAGNRWDLLGPAPSNQPGGCESPAC